MKSKNQIDKNEEDMFEYRFIEIDALSENIEIFTITAGCEDDAFDLVNEESPSNYTNAFLLSDKMLKQLKEELLK